MASRRKFLVLAGGGIVVAAGGLTAWATTRDPVAARIAWQEAGRDGADPRRFVLSYAILAPNPHNRQPWIADLSQPGEILLTCELDRRLPATDPFDRQITIGFGCFSELLMMAAAQAGYRVEATFFPEGEPAPRLDERPVARFVFARDDAVKPDPLFAHVLARHTDREGYDTSRPVAAADAALITGAARSTSAFSRVEARELPPLRALAWDAFEREVRTPAAYRESIDLMRIGKAEIIANPDGIVLDGPFLEGLYKLGLLTREMIADTNSSAFKQQLGTMRVPFDTAMGFVWIITPSNRRIDQIEAGRDHVRTHLAATGEGISLQPMSQALQEYRDMAEYFDAMRRLLGVADAETLQMFCRIGYGPEIPAAPRWQYETRIRGG